ncbi:hypothetical protein ACFVYJ_04440 [Pontibacter sp. JAM-7]|uniref:hypothetical protein n=1 Tax=Pontibacter sp. JAM-7 TaxID=3366581 RepID=UPI003AF682F6
MAAPPSPVDLLDAPEGVACKVIDNGEKIFDISWAEIDGAKKYSVELNCDSNLGDVNIEAEVAKSTITCAAGTCSGSISEAEVAEVIEDAIEAGDVEWPELTEGETLGWLCQAEVKGLNPPGKRQNHPKGKASCIEESLSICPVWAPGELSQIGSHTLSAPLTYLLKADIENRTLGSIPGTFMDYEYVGASVEGKWTFVTNTASVYKSGDNFVGSFTLATEDSQKSIDRTVFLTEAEYEACKSTLTSHSASQCQTNQYQALDGSCLDI